MKITLISPSLHKNEAVGYGIRLLSACLKQEKHNVKIIFLPREPEDTYEEKTLNKIVGLSQNSDLIGISLITDDFDEVVKINKRLKKNLDTPIIWGGIHPTIQPEQCLKHTDMVCIGEGEESIIELIEKIEKKQDFHSIQGIWFKHKEKTIKNKLRPLIQDLDKLPFQDYDYKNHYVLHKGRIEKIDEKILKTLLEKRYITVTSRGCPYGCTYCCHNTLNKMFPEHRIIRKRSIDNVIKELTIIKNKFPFIKLIYFDDDAFLMQSEKELREFSKEYKNHIKIPFCINGASPLTLTREKLSPLVDAGLTDIRMGVQTGSKRIRKLYKRHETNKQILNAVKTINEFKAQIKMPKYDMIIDNPWESEDDIIETLRMLSKFPAPYCLFLFPLTFYPESDIYEKAKEEGIIDQVNKKYHSNFKKTYFNKLFLLLNEYSTRGRRIPPRIMSLLTNKKTRLNHLLYSYLWFKNFSYKGFKYVVKRDWSRIRKKFLELK